VAPAPAGDSQVDGQGLATKAAAAPVRQGIEESVGGAFGDPARTTGQRADRGQEQKKVEVAGVLPERFVESQGATDLRHQDGGRRLRRLLEKLSVTLHGLIETLLDLHVLQVRPRRTQLGQRVRGLVAMRDSRGATRLGHRDRN